MKNMITIFMLAALLTACSSPSVKFEITSAPNLNIDERNNALPVVVRVYQLSENNLFLNSSFNDLWKRDLNVLGNTLLARKEIIIIPGKTREIVIRKHRKARFVAAMAIFRKPVADKWRSITSISSGYLSRKMSSSFNISVSGNRIEID